METSPGTPNDPRGADGSADADRRIQAFLAACELHRSTAPEILGRRPGTEPSRCDRELSSRDPVRALRELLVNELLELEAQAAGKSHSSPAVSMSGAEFFLRRRRLTRLAELKRVANGLPRLWSVLAALPASDVVRRCAEIGLDAIALATRCLARDRIAPMLAPLGRELGLAVLSRKREPKDQDCGALAAAIRGAFEIAARTREQTRLAAFVGRRAIATLHRSLAPATRDALVRMSRSNIAQKLESTPPLLVSTADRVWIESVVTRAILEPFDGFTDTGGPR